MTDHKPSSQPPEHSKEDIRILAFGFGLLFIVVAFVSLPGLIEAIG